METKEKNISDKKLEHITYALKSQTEIFTKDDRFLYEPIFATNNVEYELPEINFLNKKLKFPLWISSMTGGTSLSKKINENLAKACNEFGLAMSLGSCRPLLENKKLLDQYALRQIIGKDRILFANLGIAQIEQLISKNEINKIEDLVQILEADGIVIHINLLQEFLQNEGDIIKIPPIETIESFLELTKIPLIIKEVGQGFGPESLKKLLSLPLAGIEFGAYGGTNFSKVEINRNQIKDENYNPLIYIGHTSNEMLELVNNIYHENQKVIKCKHIIISGGIRNFLDGYYYIKKSKLPAIYGQAAKLLQFAKEDYKVLRNFISHQIKGYKLVNSLIKINN